jgi:hypothetical protein
MALINIEVIKEIVTPQQKRASIARVTYTYDPIWCLPRTACPIPIAGHC